MATSVVMEGYWPLFLFSLDDIENAFIKVSVLLYTHC